MPNIFCKYYSSVANHLKTKAMPIKVFAWGGPVEATSRRHLYKES